MWLVPQGVSELNSFFLRDSVVNVEVVCTVVAHRKIRPMLLTHPDHIVMAKGKACSWRQTENTPTRSVKDEERKAILMAIFIAFPRFKSLELVCQSWR